MQRRYVEVRLVACTRLQRNELPATRCWTWLIPRSGPRTNGTRVCRNEGHVRVRRSVPLAVACVAHAGALCALRAVSLPPHVLAVTGPDVSEIDLDMTEKEGHSAVALASTTIALRTPGREPRVGIAAAKAEATVLLVERGMSPPREEAPSLESRPSDWSFSPTAMRMDVRAAVTPDLVGPKGAVRLDETSTGARTTGSPTGGVAEGLVAHDVAVGMGRGGPILAAAESAARSSDAPLDGGATLDVVIRSDGMVTARVSSADGDVDAWTRVAASLEHSVDPTRIRMPARGRGWQVVVRVEAKVQLADGRDVRSLHGLRGSLAPSALESAMEGTPGARGSSTGPGGPDNVGAGPSEPPPVGGVLGSGRPSNAGAGAAQAIAQAVLPAPTLSISGKICSASLRITPLGIGLGGGCSPENVGTGTRRIVSGRIVSESSL
jgi:hypothetical protein